MPAIVFPVHIICQVNDKKLHYECEAVWVPNVKSYRLEDATKWERIVSPDGDCVYMFQKRDLQRFAVGVAVHHRGNWQDNLQDVIGSLPALAREEFSKFLMNSVEEEVGPISAKR